jgi:drug/metabolite transporter superfamily protein YnfA
MENCDTPSQPPTALAHRTMWGAVYIAAAIRWLWAIDGIRPSVWDVTGAGIALVGMAVIVLQPGPSR